MIEPGSRLTLAVVCPAQASRSTGHSPITHLATAQELAGRDSRIQHGVRRENPLHWSHQRLADLLVPRRATLPLPPPRPHHARTGPLSRRLPTLDACYPPSPTVSPASGRLVLSLRRRPFHPRQSPPAPRPSSLPRTSPLRTAQTRRCKPVLPPRCIKGHLPRAMGSRWRSLARRCYPPSAPANRDRRAASPAAVAPVRSMPPAAKRAGQCLLRQLDQAPW